VAFNFVAGYIFLRRFVKEGKLIVSEVKMGHEIGNKCHLLLLAVSVKGFVLVCVCVWGQLYFTFVSTSLSSG